MRDDLHPRYPLNPTDSTRKPRVLPVNSTTGAGAAHDEYGRSKHFTTQPISPAVSNVTEPVLGLVLIDGDWFVQDGVVPDGYFVIDGQDILIDTDVASGQPINIVGSSLLVGI